MKVNLSSSFFKTIIIVKDDLESFIQKALANLGLGGERRAPFS
jgi:hypothetical protein